MPFCHGRKSVSFRLNDTPPSLQLCAPRLKAAGKRPVQAQITSQHRNTIESVTTETQAATTSSINVPGSQLTSTITCASNTRSTCVAKLQDAPAKDTLQQKGLCSAFASTAATATADCLGILPEDDHEYVVYTWTKEPTSTQNVSLATLLMQDIFFPLAPPDTPVSHGEPYVLTTVTSTEPDKLQGSRKNRSYSTLGIVLLELYFDKRLEEHKLWFDPDYQGLEQNPTMRQTVACEWLKAVQGEAGEDCLTAVNWTLKEAPVELKDERWREDFARHVVQPLQECYDYMHPKKGS